MKVASVKKKGKNNCRVAVDSGLEIFEVPVPKELGFEGAELDECRLHQTKKDGWVYLSLSSHNYKRNCIDYSLLSKEHWDAFYSMSRASFCKFVGFDWIKFYEVKDLLADFQGQAAISGVPYRMFQRTEGLRPGYDGVTVFPSPPWMRTIPKNKTTRKGLIRMRREGRLPDYPWERFKSIGLV